MSQKSLKQSLPYAFCNIGAAAGAQRNIARAESLLLDTLCVIEDLRLDIITKDTYGKRYKSEATVKAGNIDAKNYIEAFSSEHAGLNLWMLKFWSGSLQLHFCNPLASPTKPPELVSAVINIDCPDVLILEAKALPFRSYDYRRLRYEHGIDAAWGSFVRIDEWAEGHGVQTFFTYPEADEIMYERIARV